LLAPLGPRSVADPARRPQPGGAERAVAGHPLLVGFRAARRAAVDRALPAVRRFTPAPKSRVRRLRSRAPALIEGRAPTRSPPRSIPSRPTSR
jgi:hypothetical protein